MRKFAAAIILALLTISGASAAKINALFTTAMKAAIDELMPQFERASGHKVLITYGPSGGLARRLNEGQPADLIMIASTELDELIKQGKVASGRTDVAATAIGICVKKGAPRPDVSSAAALKRALLAAKTVAHTAPAGGGITAAHIMRMFEKLGIVIEMAPKIRLAAGGPNGRVSVLVSSGEAEIGLQQVSELMSNPEVDVIQDERKPLIIVLHIHQHPRPICFRLERQVACRAFSRACAKTGNRMAARIAMIAITTRSSISVKAALR